MKINLVLGLLLMSVLLLVVAGCAQGGTNTAGQTPVNLAPETGSTTPTSVKFDQESVTPQIADNKSAAAAPISNTGPQLTKISEILGNSKSYKGKIVIVEGKIMSECGSGCWFTLKDGNAVLYIDLAPNNMVIPQKRGANARVTGEIVNDGTDIYMVGNKVDF